MCRFESDIDRFYVADIISATPGFFTCKFVHSGSIYDFETVNWTVAKQGQTFHAGTRLIEHHIYKKSDDQDFPRPVRNESRPDLFDNPAFFSSNTEQKLVCVTFDDDNRYLGQLTETTVEFNRHITFLHSGVTYIFGEDNMIIDDGGGAYKRGRYIKNMEIYIPEELWPDISVAESEEGAIEAVRGALNTDWSTYFENYTMEQIQTGLENGKKILKEMVDTTVAKAKLISHAFANPVSGEDLARDALKSGLDLLSGNEIGFIKKASKTVFGGILGSFVEILRANEARGVSEIRAGLYRGYMYGCFAALYGSEAYTLPEDKMEKQFYDLGVETIMNLSIRDDMRGDAFSSEYMRADLLIALVESYRTRQFSNDGTYDLEEYKRHLRDGDTLWAGFELKLSNLHTRTDD